MPRPMDDEADLAYEYWRDTAKRSIPATAAFLGRGDSTVRYWARVGAWQERLARETTSSVRAMLEVSRYDLADALQLGIPEMLDIVTNRRQGRDDADRPYFLTSDKDRVNAFRALVEAQKALTPREGTNVPTVSIIDMTPRGGPIDAEHTPSLIEAASRLLEGNVASAR